MLQDNYNEGTIVQGIISFGGDEWATGYILQNIIILSTKNIIEENDSNNSNQKLNLLVIIFSLAITLSLGYFIYKKRNNKRQSL